MHTHTRVELVYLQALYGGPAAVAVGVPTGLDAVQHA